MGPCDNSVRNGGPGCHLCDVVAMLPQQEFSTKDFTKRGRGRPKGIKDSKPRKPKTGKKREGSGAESGPSMLR
jgi:hypothetical protein